LGDFGLEKELYTVHKFTGYCWKSIMTDAESPQQTAELSIEQALQQALARHQAGQLQEAGELYRVILQAHPNHPEANYNMGVLAVQMKQPAAGLPYFMAALDAEPARGQYWLNYIDALFQAGQLEDARQVLALAQQQGLQGDEVEALALRLKDGAPLTAQANAENRQAIGETLPVSSAAPQNSQKTSKTKHSKPNKSTGKSVTHQGNSPSHQETNTLMMLFTEGRLAEAAALAQAMTVRFPLYAFGWKALGAVFQQMGRSADALAPIQKAAALSPSDANTHNTLGNILSDLGRLDEAEVSLRRALEIKPDYADAYSNLGANLYDLKRLDEAEASYRRALQINPDLADAHYNLGNTLKSLGRLDEAETSYRRALQIKPDYAQAHSNLGITLNDLGRPDEAEVSLRRALQIKPDYAQAYSNLGNALKDLGRQDEAEASYRRALQIKPDLAEAHSNLGGILEDMVRLGEAEASYRQALEINPNFAKAHSNLLFLLNYTSCIAPSYDFAAASQYGKNVADKIKSRFVEWTCARQPERLRIGFVSGDFKNHPIGYFLEGMLAKLDPNSLELIAYQTDNRADEITARIKPHFSAWKSLFGLSDEAAAQLIHNDSVHVLIDLSGHTRYNRLPVFAWKPAPVQASWLGYLGTTGVAAMDYLIADPWTLPVTEEVHFSEKIWRLPETYLCFTPPDEDVAVAPLPAISNGYITFGSFNNLAKMNDAVVALWARVLQNVPESRLFLKTKQLKDASVRKIIVERFAAQGIDTRRLALEGNVPQRMKHLESYNRVDIALDPFPYPGITTSVEGLWMGVPLITLSGERFLSRQGVGLLMNAGLPEWIASDADDYVARAVSHASDLQRLAKLRNGLRQQVLASPIMDTRRFAMHFGAALRDMWRNGVESNKGNE
jgi:predicted O-linked N-acetylglucosamine transferase (SPINDLY family)